MTNYHWQFSIEQMRERLRFDNLVVVNDFTALAMSLPSLLPHQRRQVGGGAPVARSVHGLIGAGSGLGVSGLIPAAQGWIALGTEGGHTSFSPRDEREMQILRFAWRQLSHVSFERLLSGPGHRTDLSARSPTAPVSPARASARPRSPAARWTSDPLCVEVIEAFCAILGTAAANLAVTLGAFGGIYIGGGIVPRLGEYFDRSGFRRRFEDKGRFSDYMQGIPTYRDHRRARHLHGRLGHPVGAAARRWSRPRLRPSSTRCAARAAACRRPSSASPTTCWRIRARRSTIRLPRLARDAEVSQPTVIRFCRSLGCEGLSDFKLRLASGLTGTMPVTHTQVTGEDTSWSSATRCWATPPSAILQVRDHLNRETIDRAIELLGEAERVEFYAVGHYGGVADDAQFKFLRFGVSSACLHRCRACRRWRPTCCGPATWWWSSAAAAGSTSCSRWPTPRAERGAAVIAITASQSPLARKADVALIVDHVEDIATQVPMISRILHLLMIDILVVGVSMRRGENNLPRLGSAAAMALDEGQPEQPRRVARLTGPGVSSAGDLADITSHSRSSD